MNKFPGFWLVAILLTAGPVQAQTPLSDLQARAEASLAQGDAALTEALARQLLAQDPEGYVGHLLLALALSDQGDFNGASRAAGQAYRRAETKPDKLVTARLAGTAHFQAGHFARSELWFRRAANHIDTDEDAESVVRAFHRAQQANPFSSHYSASIAPTDNINGGASTGDGCFQDHDGSCVWGFTRPEDQQALSGLEYTASARLGYRLSRSERQHTSISALIQGQAYTLSDEARDLLDSSPIPEVQDVTAPDFAAVLAELSLIQRQRDLSPLGPTRTELAFGKYWQGGEPLVRYRDLILEQDIPIGDAGVLSVGWQQRDQTALVPDLQDTLTTEISAGWRTLLPNDDGIRFTLAAKDSAAGRESSYVEYRAGIDYAPQQRVLNSRWSVSFEAGQRSFPEYPTTLDGREDLFATLGMTAVFENWSYLGFSPSVSLSATRMESDVKGADTTSAALRFGIASNF